MIDNKLKKNCKTVVIYFYIGWFTDKIQRFWGIWNYQLNINII